MAKHRAPRYVRTKTALAGVPVAAGATVVGLSVLSTPAQASTTHDWTGVAQCESGGDWNINTGNGYYGGLQFSQQTWAGYGGTSLAARADLATPAEQVQIAEKVLAGQGVGAWPTCGKYLTDGTTAAATQAPTAAAPAAAAPAAPAQQETTAPAETQHWSDNYGRHAARGDYTVRRGDTIAKIAAAHHQTWRDLYQRNVGVIGSNPNRLVPGEVLVTSGTAAPAAPAAPAASVAPAPAPAAAPATTVAHITNSAGPVKPQTQAAANAVVSNVPGAANITLGGTRASAVDPNGHPSGLALDYMVEGDTALGHAIVQYTIDHWSELGVEYVIYQQKILTSPGGTWTQMEDRGSPTANHMDHVHVNYLG